MNPRNSAALRPFLKRWLRESGGAEIAEAAIVLPLVFLFLFAIIWFGLAFNIYSTITSAAREGARVAAIPACATCGSPLSNWGGTNLPGDSTVESAVLGILQASHVDTSNITVYQPASLTFCTPPPSTPAGACDAPTSHNITVCRFVQLNPAGLPQQCGTIVSFQYPFQFLLSYTPAALGSHAVTITAEAQAMMEN